MLAEVRQKFQQGEWPSGCERCRIEEHSGIRSKRQLDQERWQVHYEQYDFARSGLLTISMALGNTCNLKCIMCSPAASSLWRQEYQTVYGIDQPAITQFRKNTIASILEISPDLVHMDIHGGEPFLSAPSDHAALLDHYIQNGTSDRVSIHYTTNGLVWPSEQLWQQWQHFREIDLQISIDGVGQHYDYIRFPGRWQDLVRNIERYQTHQQQTSNFRISVAHTVTAYNVRYLPEFFDWCERSGLPSPWTGRLHNPPQLRPTVWGADARQSIMAALKHSARPEVQAWHHHVQHHDDSALFDQFQHYVRVHDNYRQLDFRLTFPEMAEFI